MLTQQTPGPRTLWSVPRAASPSPSAPISRVQNRGQELSRQIGGVPQAGGVPQVGVEAVSPESLFQLLLHTPLSPSHRAVPQGARCPGCAVPRVHGAQGALWQAGGVKPQNKQAVSSLGIGFT